MGHIWGRQDPGGPHVGPMNFVIWECLAISKQQWAWYYFFGYIWLTHWDWDKMSAIFGTKMFKCIFLNENVQISIKISLKFVPKGPINNIPALVQIMVWSQTSYYLKQWWLSLQMHMHVTWPHWVNIYLKLLDNIIQNDWWDFWVPEALWK